MLPNWMYTCPPDREQDDVSDIGSDIHIVEHGDCIEMVPTPNSSKDSNNNDDFDKKSTDVETESCVSGTESIKTKIKSVSARTLNSVKSVSDRTVSGVKHVSHTSINAIKSTSTATATTIKRVTTNSIDAVKLAKTNSVNGVKKATNKTVDTLNSISTSSVNAVLSTKHSVVLKIVSTQQKVARTVTSVKGNVTTTVACAKHSVKRSVLSGAQAVKRLEPCRPFHRLANRARIARTRTSEIYAAKKAACADFVKSITGEQKRKGVFALSFLFIASYVILREIAIYELSTQMNNLSKGNVILRDQVRRYSMLSFGPLPEPRKYPKKITIGKIKEDSAGAYFPSWVESLRSRQEGGLKKFANEKNSAHWRAPMLPPKTAGLKVNHLARRPYGPERPQGPLPAPAPSMAFWNSTAAKGQYIQTEGSCSAKKIVQKGFKKFTIKKPEQCSAGTSKFNASNYYRFYDTENYTSSILENVKTVLKEKSCVWKKNNIVHKFSYAQEKLIKAFKPKSSSMKPQWSVYKPKKTLEEQTWNNVINFQRFYKPKRAPPVTPNVKNADKMSTLNDFLNMTSPLKFKHFGKILKPLANVCYGYTETTPLLTDNVKTIDFSAIKPLPRWSSSKTQDSAFNPLKRSSILSASQYTSIGKFQASQRAQQLKQAAANAANYLNNMKVRLEKIEAANKANELLFMNEIDGNAVPTQRTIPYSSYKKLTNSESWRRNVRKSYTLEEGESFYRKMPTRNLGAARDFAKNFDLLSELNNFKPTEFGPHQWTPEMEVRNGGVSLGGKFSVFDFTQFNKPIKRSVSEPPAYCEWQPKLNLDSAKLFKDVNESIMRRNTTLSKGSYTTPTYNIMEELAQMYGKKPVRTTVNKAHNHFKTRKDMNKKSFKHSKDSFRMERAFRDLDAFGPKLNVTKLGTPWFPKQSKNPGVFTDRNFGNVHWLKTSSIRQYGTPATSSGLRMGPGIFKNPGLNFESHPLFKKFKPMSQSVREYKPVSSPNFSPLSTLLFEKSDTTPVTSPGLRVPDLGVSKFMSRKVRQMGEYLREVYEKTAFGPETSPRQEKFSLMPLAENANSSPVSRKPVTNHKSMRALPRKHVMAGKYSINAASLNVNRHNDAEAKRFVDDMWKYDVWKNFEHHREQQKPSCKGESHFEELNGCPFVEVHQKKSLRIPKIDLDSVKTTKRFDFGFFNARNSTFSRLYDDLVKRNKQTKIEKVAEVERPQSAKSLEFAEKIKALQEKMSARIADMKKKASEKTVNVFEYFKLPTMVRSDRKVPNVEDITAKKGDKPYKIVYSTSEAKGGNHFDKNVEKDGEKKNEKLWNPPRFWTHRRQALWDDL